MSEPEQKDTKKQHNTAEKTSADKSRPALTMRKPLMLEASNEEAKLKKDAAKSSKDSSTSATNSTTKAKKTTKTISETTSKVEKTIPPKHSAKTRVIPITIPPKKTKTNPDDNAKSKKTAKKDMKLPILRKIHIKPSYIVGIIFVILITVFFGRVALWEHGYISSMEGSDRDTSTPGVNTGIGAGNSENDDGNNEEAQEPTDCARDHVVSPNMPRLLNIPSIGIINRCIAEVGLDSNGAIGVPKSHTMIGWYNGSVLPGEKGTALLDAHGGDLGDGIFRKLPRIQIGADINIEMGDGRLFTYKVVDTATRPIDGNNNADQYMPTALTSPQAGAASLTLITCTGEWSQVRQTYLDRFFVRAVLQ